MSLENVVEFWKKVKTDKALQERVHPSAKVPKLSKDVKAEQLEELANIAKASGFPCTARELAATESVVRFWSAVSTDPALKSSLSKLDSLGEKQATEETVKVAAKNGYSFTAEDLSTLTPVIIAGNPGALSDRQLDGVVGGAAAVTSSLNFALQGGFSINFRMIGPGAVAQYM
jgi:predicted ribosomally synthesized peptide with nif11-like leader